MRSESSVSPDTATSASSFAFNSLCNRKGVLYLQRGKETFTHSRRKWTHAL